MLVGQSMTPQQRQLHLHAMADRPLCLDARLLARCQPVCQPCRTKGRCMVLCQSAPGSKGEQQQRTQTTEVRAQSHATAMPQTAQQEAPDMECVASGLDSVSCYVVDPVTHEGHKARQDELDKLQQLSHVQDSKEQSGDTAWQTALSIALLISPFAFWGTSMVAMKGLMTAVPPMVMGAFRLLPAGFILIAWAAAQGRPQPSTWKAWAWVSAFALVDGAAFQGFLAEGLQRTSAGLGSVIIDSQPLTVAALAAVLFGESLGWNGVAGLLMGVAGLLLLELPEQYLLLAADGVLQKLPGTSAQSLASAADNLSAAAGETATAVVGAVTTAATEQLPAAAQQLPAMAASSAAQLADAAQQWPADAWTSLTLTDLIQLGAPSSWASSGELWMLAAAQSMAVGTVMCRYVMQHADPVMATGWHMVLGGLLLTGIALADDPQCINQAVANLQPSDLAAALYVSLLGGAASYGIFFWQASTQGNLTKLSSLTFLTPVFAAVTGYFVLGEVLTAPQLLGGAVTLSSVFVINNSSKSKAEQDEKQGQQDQH